MDFFVPSSIFLAQNRENWIKILKNLKVVSYLKGHSIEKVWTVFFAKTKKSIRIIFFKNCPQTNIYV